MPVTIARTAHFRTPAAARRTPGALTVHQTFVVNLAQGLHARPCALLVKRLQRFRSSVEVEHNGERASGHSIMSLMALAASCGTEVTFAITGVDAAEAMAEVSRLFETHFEDAYRMANLPPEVPAPAGSKG